MYWLMELINIRPTIGAEAQNGHDISPRYVAMFLVGGGEKIKTQRQASHIWLMLAAVLFS